MARYIVTANKLNQRSAAPVSFAEQNIMAVVNKGYTFDGTPVPAEQLANPALGTFIRDNSNGHVVWGAGVMEGAPTSNSSIIKPPVNYNTLIRNIPDSWRNTGGAGVKVAILDTGCFPHDALQGSIIAQYNAIDKGNDVTDVSDSSHGTFLAGMIAARSNANIVGIAPNVSLIVIKVSVNDVGVKSNDVLEGLRWLSQQIIKPDIVNISLSFDPFPNQNDFQSYFRQLSASAIILAAAQNDANLITTNIFYPATETNVNGVGALALGGSIMSNGNYQNIETSVKYIVQDVSFYSTNKLNSYNNGSGCSFSTAFTSGICALAKSFQNSQQNGAKLIDYLNQNTPLLTPSLFNTDLKLFKTQQS